MRLLVGLADRGEAIVDAARDLGRAALYRDIDEARQIGVDRVQGRRAVGALDPDQRRDGERHDGQQDDDRRHRRLAQRDRGEQLHGTRGARSR